MQTRALWPMVILAAVLLAGSACRDPSFPNSVQALIRGTVRAAGGFPAEGATVVFEVVRTSDSLRVGAEPTQTDAQGNYSALLAVFTDPFEGTMSVSATWDFGGSSQAATVTGIAVPFRRPGDQVETIVVDITLQPVSAGRVSP